MRLCGTGGYVATEQGGSETAPGPLFETPRTRLLAASSREIGEVLERLFDEPLRPTETMATEVRDYLVLIEKQARSPRKPRPA